MLITLFYLASTKIHAQDGFFVDKYGRKTLYHGVNVVFKTFPFYPDTQHFSSNFSLTRQDLQNLRSWGMNMIRLHVPWQGIQSQKGIYNHTLIDKLKQIVSMCQQFGINVLLDSHQDLFSKKFCGEGVPDWAVQTKNFPFPLKVKIDVDKNGYPDRESCSQVQFGLFYTTEDVNRFQEALLTNKNNLTDSFGMMWRQVARQLQSHQNIIGYQLLNQPSGPNLFKHPLPYVIPGRSNNKYLAAFYKRLIKHIRQVDNQTIVFYQPATTDIFNGGFDFPVQGQAHLDRQAFSYHIYCPFVTPMGEPTSQRKCEIFDKLQQNGKIRNGKSLKIPYFLTQFGALSNVQGSSLQIQRITRAAQNKFSSWCYWQFKYYNDITTAARPPTTESFYFNNGSLQQRKVKALSRAYFSSICGTPLSTDFNQVNLILTLKFVPNKCVKNSQVFISPSYFSLGFQVIYEPKCAECGLRKIDGGWYQIELSQQIIKVPALSITIKGY